MALTYTKTDFGTTTLNGAISSSATSMTIGTGLNIPAANGILQLDYDSTAAVGATGGPETIIYTAYVTGTGAVTGVTRAQANTTGVAHANGASVQYGMSSLHLTSLVNIATANSTTGNTSNSVTFVSASISKAFTTTGGQVTAFVGFSARTGTAGDFMGFRVKRDSTVLKTKTNIGGGGTNNERYDAAFMAIETPAAGAYTYDIEFNRASGAGTITQEDACLWLMETPV